MILLNQGKYYSDNNDKQKKRNLERVKSVKIIVFLNLPVQIVNHFFFFKLNGLK